MAHLPALAIPGAIGLAEAQPGDIVGFDTSGPFGRIIQFRQWLSRSDRRYRRVKHIAILREYVPNNPSDRGDPVNWTVVQAARRVERAELENVANGRPFVVMPLPSGIDRDRVLATADEEVGDKYGVASILSIAANLLTPTAIRLNFRRVSTWICSALGAWCLHAGGWLQRWPDVYQVKPADLIAAIVQALTQGELTCATRS